MSLSHRVINIFFFLLLAYVFVLFCKSDDHIRIAIAFIGALLFGITALLLNWLTLDGVRAAVLFGTISYGIGDFTGASVVSGFFITSSLVSQNKVIETSDTHPDTKRFRRDGGQVWANGFWFALFMLVWFLSQSEVFLFAAVASIAAANSDTWATELGGNYKPGKTWLITTFKDVKPGTDGGISIKGLLAALIGSAVIAGVFYLVNQSTPIDYIIALSAAGFVGSLIDSILGATIQDKYFHFRGELYTIGNNIINAISTGSASLAIIITYFFI